MDPKRFEFAWMAPLEKHFLSVNADYEAWQAQRDREKHEQLQEILGSYSNNGLPPLPELLTFGRPTFDEKVFGLEAHWSILVDNASALTKRQHDQQEAVWELLHTELSYISQIRVIVDVFKSCLLNVQQEGLLNEIELERLFGNIDQILDSNQTLWQDSLTKVLEDARVNRRPLNPSLMKSAFVKEFKSLIQPYTRNCMEQKQCVEYMKMRHTESDLFKIFVMWAEAQKQCNRLKLTDLLVKPMQRLTKYSLLLQAILRKTDDDRQRRDLLEMIASVDKFVLSINSQMQQQHELERLEAIMTKIDPYDAVEAPNDECVKIIQDYNANFNLLAPMCGFRSVQNRSLLMHSSLRMKEAQSRTDVDCFLFTDLLLVCKSSKRMDKFKIIRAPMSLNQVVVSELKDKGSFLLIYLNEYLIPMAAYTFHGDQAAVRVFLEKIRDAVRDYRRKLQEDAREHLAASMTVMEEVEYTALPREGPLTMDRTPHSAFPRSASTESTDGHYMPNLAPNRGHGIPLERTGSCNEMQSPNSVSGTSRGIPDHAHSFSSSSNDFSPTSDRRHKPVKQCYSVPNMAAGQLSVANGEDDDQGLSMDTRSVRRAVGSPSSSMYNLAEPGPVDDEDVNGRINKNSARRTSRSAEKRYYTADSIQELRQHKDKDSSIHKRLSWQNENHLDDKLRSKVLSTDSIPSSSGVSSTGSLHLDPNRDISEEIDLTRSGSSRTLQGDGSPSGSVDLSGQSKSTPDIVQLFHSLKTGEAQDGIVSVDMPAVNDGPGRRLTHSQILKMKKQLLLDTNVEASEV
ncbi:hypothetical protein V1264_007200 [Littorina saxatilis]|uniref:DH domain-containing protein n=1 Tax=Littorina saxatilis TaxID=31220 RepID=A0AAN9AVQ4_9CAEN